jgi:hypothetical protein
MTSNRVGQSLFNDGLAVPQSRQTIRCESVQRAHERETTMAAACLALETRCQRPALES